MKNILYIILIAGLGMVACQSNKGTKKEPRQKEEASTMAPIYTTPQGPNTNDPPEAGEKVYQDNCLACHQTDGKGVSGMFPPLVKNEITTNKVKLIRNVLYGREGPITVDGKEYNNQMPALDYLSDEDIAAVLTYVSKTFVGSEIKVSAKEVADIRAQK